MLNKLRGKKQSEVLMEKIHKLHALVVEADKKENDLQKALSEARLGRATAMLDAAEKGSTADSSTRKLVRDIQDDIEDHRALLAGLVQKKKQAIREYHVADFKDRMTHKAELQKKADDLNAKIEESAREIKRLSDLHTPIFNEIITTNENFKTFEHEYRDVERGYADPGEIGSAGKKLETLATEDAFLPFSPVEWREICEAARKEGQVSIYVNKNGDII